MMGVLVAGGGLAGGSSALWLARAGLRVRLLERDLYPTHKICGEFLSWEAQVWLKDLGVDLARLGAVPIDRIRLVAGDCIAESRLGFTGQSVTRLRLDAALLEAARAAGVEVVRGCQVRSMEPDGTVLTSHGPQRPDLFVAATGKHALRGMPRSREGTMDHLLGFKTYFRLRPEERQALSGHVELILFRGGYAGLQLVEQEMANLCLLVSAERYFAAGGRFPALVESLMAETPHLARRLAHAAPLLDRPLAISQVPYGYLWTHAAGHPANRYPVGDQASVIPSFTGDGMGLSLHGARLAVRAILTGAGPEAYARDLQRDVGPALRRASRLQAVIGEDPARHLMVARLARLVPQLLTTGAKLTRVSKGSVRALAGPGATGSEALRFA
jgi:flavin-dependent dehydrogenase